MRRKRYIIGGAALLGISAATAFALSLSQRDLFGVAYVPSSMLSLFNLSGDANSNSGNTSSGSIAGTYASNTQGSDSLGTLDLPPDSVAISADTEVAGLQEPADPSEVDETSGEPGKGTGEQGQGTGDLGQGQPYIFKSGDVFAPPQRLAAVTTMSAENPPAPPTNPPAPPTNPPAPPSNPPAPPTNPPAPPTNPPAPPTNPPAPPSNPPAPPTNPPAPPSNPPAPPSNPPAPPSNPPDCTLDDKILDVRICPSSSTSGPTSESGPIDENDPPTKVDEPGTLSLLLMSGLGLLLARRRATRKTA
jgi:hypothetical protein